MSSSRLYKQSFFGNSSWTCPAGVRYVILTGCGGGGGGGGGSGADRTSGYAVNMSGAGGEPALTTTQVFYVTPSLTYNVTLGLGGGGGNGVTGLGLSAGLAGNGTSGARGGDTSFGSISFAGGAGGIFGAAMTTATDQYLRSYLIQPKSGINNRGNIGPTQWPAGGVGGGAGGVSNNIYSYGGYGGSGSNDINWTYNVFAIAGTGGGYGGGGGGGGSGSNSTYWTNNHDGANGGPGGAGFIEIAWIQ
jgi:hypothetical protein